MDPINNSLTYFVFLENSDDISKLTYRELNLYSHCIYDFHKFVHVAHAYLLVLEKI